MGTVVALGTVLTPVPLAILDGAHMVPWHGTNLASEPCGCW